METGSTTRTQEDRRRKSLENKIKYWTEYLDREDADTDARLAVRLSQTDGNQRKEEHARKRHAEQRARTEERRQERLRPLEAEYRALIGLDE